MLARTVRASTCVSVSLAAILAVALLLSPVVQSASAAQALKVKVTEKQDPITRGSNQTITVKVTDAKGKAVKDASVSGTILYASTKTIKPFSGKTNANGEFVYTWQIGGNSNPGIFGVEVKAIKSGFDTGYASTTFKVMPKK